MFEVIFFDPFSLLIFQRFESYGCVIFTLTNKIVAQKYTFGETLGVNVIVFQNTEMAHVADSHQPVQLSCLV